MIAGAKSAGGLDGGEPRAPRRARFVRGGFARVRVPKLALSGKVVETLLQGARQMNSLVLPKDEEAIKAELATAGRNAVSAKCRAHRQAREARGARDVQEIVTARTSYEPLRRNSRWRSMATTRPRDQMHGELRRNQTVHRRRQCSSTRRNGVADAKQAES